MLRHVNISKARKELPALFDRVTTHDGEKILIRRRDEEREAVLVSRDYVERLELSHRRAASEKPFRLIGSGKLLVSDEEALAEIRAGEARASEQRRKEFAPQRQARSR